MSKSLTDMQDHLGVILWLSMKNSSPLQFRTSLLDYTTKVGKKSKKKTESSSY